MEPVIIKHSCSESLHQMNSRCSRESKADTGSEIGPIKPFTCFQRTSRAPWDSLRAFSRGLARGQQLVLSFFFLLLLLFYRIFLCERWITTSALFCHISELLAGRGTPGLKGCFRMVSKPCTTPNSLAEIPKWPPGLSPVRFYVHRIKTWFNVIKLL